MAATQQPRRAEQRLLPNRLVRFSAWQRLEHWLLAACFMGLLATGLPQKLNDAGVSVWIVNSLGGIDNVRFFHRILASVFVLESLLHLGEIGLGVVRRRLRPSMVITLQDFRDVFNMLRYSMGLRPDRPQFDRYDYRQKFEYWGIVFGAIIMIATGLVLWFPAYATRLLPGELVPAAKEMHSGEALLALLVIVVWHFYDVVLSPSVFPLDTAMITGTISLERLHEEHPKEYTRLVGGALPEQRAADRPTGEAATAPELAAPVPEPPPSLHAAGVSGVPGTGVVRRNLYWRVMILVGIGMACVLAAFSVSSFLAVDQSVDRTLDERQALAEITARQVDYVIRQGLQILEESVVSEGFDPADADLAPEQRALRQALSGSIFTRFYITGADGRVVLTEPARDSLVGVNLGSLAPRAELVLQDRKPFVSGLLSAAADGSPAVSIVAPVADGQGGLAGLVAGDVALAGSELTDIIRPAALGSSGYAQIVDISGAVLASTRSGQLLERSDHEGQIASLIEKGQTVSGTCHGCHQLAGREEERETEVMAFAPLEMAPWGVLIRQSEEEALSPARALRERAILFGVPAFLVALLIAWATARSVLRPMGILAGAAERIAAGDLSEPVPPLGRDEVGGLARAFETMRVRLKQSLDGMQSWSRQLEERVQGRTRELEASRDHLRRVAEENAALYEALRRKEEARTALLKKVIGAQEEERGRIARELHDQTGQAITALAVGIDTAAMTPEGDAEKVRERLWELRDLAKRTLEDVHQIIHDLRPSVLDDLGLVAGLRWYAENRLQPAGIRSSVMVTGEENRLPAEVETALFRIGQEAITNAAWHAQAANLLLGLDFTDGCIALEVEDDGVGFDTASLMEVAGGRRGLGILGMQERAALLGGTLDIFSEPGGGTRVRATIPLERQEGGHGREDSGAGS